MTDLSKEERNAIAALKRLAKRWPKSLWLFSASGTLWVMKKNDAGEPAFVIGPHGDDSVDQDYCATHIDIENDGGDW